MCEPLFNALRVVGSVVGSAALGPQPTSLHHPTERRHSKITPKE